MTNKAEFVQEEFRKTSVENSAIKATFGKKARKISVMTQLDKNNAQLLAQKMLDANQETVIVHKQEIEGIILPDAFIDGIPTYIPDYPKHKTDGRTEKLVFFSCDLETGITTIRTRG